MLTVTTYQSLIDMTREYVIQHIADIYSAEAEYPFASSPDCAVFRHHNNKKWFAMMMTVSKDKLGLKSTENIDIINVKSDPILIGNLMGEDGFYPAYHMNKTHWLTIALDGSADDEKLKFLLDLSFDLTSKK